MPPKPSSGITGDTALRYFVYLLVGVIFGLAIASVALLGINKKEVDEVEHQNRQILRAIAILEANPEVPDEDDVICTAQPPITKMLGQLVGDIEGFFYNITTNLRELTFAESGRTCIVASTQNGYIFRWCDGGERELWLDLTSMIHFYGYQNEGLIGMTFNDAGSEMYLDIVIRLNATGHEPPAPTPCDTANWNLPPDYWLTFPPTSTMQTIRYDLLGSGDVPSNPYYLMSHFIFGEFHPGQASLEWLEYKGKDTLLISRGINTYWGDQFGFCTNVDAIQCKTWAMDLHARSLAPEMEYPVRTLAEFPSSVRASLRSFLSGNRNAVPPVHMNNLVTDKTFFYYTQPGIDNGESAFGQLDLEEEAGRPRFTGYPQYTGLVGSGQAVDPPCSAKKRSVDDPTPGEYILGHRIHEDSHIQNREARSPPIGEPFVPTQWITQVAMQDLFSAEGRQYPFGFGGGWAAVNFGFSTVPQCGAFIGASLTLGPNAGKNSCPYAVTSCFQTFRSPAGLGGVVAGTDPEALNRTGYHIDLPYFTAWKPDFANPERQAKSILISPIDALQLEGDMYYFGTAFSGAQDPHFMLAAFVVFPKSPYTYPIVPRNVIYKLWFV